MGKYGVENLTAPLHLKQPHHTSDTSVKYVVKHLINILLLTTVFQRSYFYSAVANIEESYNRATDGLRLKS